MTSESISLRWIWHNTAENESLFKRLDNIESKLDRLLESEHGKV